MADDIQQMTSEQFAGKVRTKYPGEYDHLNDQELTQRVVSKYPEYGSVVKDAPILGGNPTGMANRALELASPGRGMQVSGKEMAPARQPTATALHTGTAGMSTPVAGALSAGVDIGNGLAESGKEGIPVSTALNPFGGAYQAAKGIVSLPKAAGEHIGESVNAFRNDYPIEGWQHGLEGAGDTAQALTAGHMLAKPEIAGPIVRGAAKTLNAGIRNAPPVLGAVGGLAGVIEGAERGGPIGGLMGGTWGAYGGTRLGRYIQKIPPVSETFGLPKEPIYDPAVLPDVNAPMRGEAAGPPAGVGPKPAVASPAVQYGENAGKRTIFPGSPEAEKPTVAAPKQAAIESPNEVAQGAGYKNVTQAMSTLGPAGWKQLYEKLTSAPVTAVGGHPVTATAPQIAPPMTESAPVQQFPALDFKPSAPRELPDVASPQWRWKEAQDDLAIRDKMEREYGTDLAPTVKPQYLRLSDNAPVTHQWTLEHPGEFYAKEVPHEFADTIESRGMQAEQPMSPTSRVGRAVNLEQLKNWYARNDASTPKESLTNITWPKRK